MDLISTTKNTLTTMLGDRARIHPHSEQELSAVGFLTAQHREVDALFARYDELAADAYRIKEQLLLQVVAKLNLHAKLEEEVFYPAMKAVDAAAVLEAVEEHAIVKDLLLKLGELAAEDETFDAKVTVLRELVHHHVREEEGVVFPEAEVKLGEEVLRRLGREMQAAADAIRKGKLPKRGRRSEASNAEPH